MPFAYQDKRGKPLPKYPMNGQLPGISKSADIMYQDRPQFNIFAVRDFRSLPIHLIWVNERLVYYAGYNDLQPYSFFGEKGYNKVRVRLIDGEYTLDSI